MRVAVHVCWLDAFQALCLVLGRKGACDREEVSGTMRVSRSDGGEHGPGVRGLALKGLKLGASDPVAASFSWYDLEQAT